MKSIRTADAVHNLAAGFAKSMAANTSTRASRTNADLKRSVEALETIASLQQALVALDEERDTHKADFVENITGPDYPEVTAILATRKFVD